MSRIGEITTVAVDGKDVTGAIYHVRENGWPCIETVTGRQASGPEILINAVQAAEFFFGSGPFITDPCRDGTHDCRFRGCQCPGHQRGAPCTLGVAER